MSEPNSLYEALVAAEQHDRACCTLCIAWRPKRRLRRFKHRLWICACGQAWRTECGPYEKVTWLWRRWSA
jgi:hypothetical protein